MRALRQTTGFVPACIAATLFAPSAAAQCPSGYQVNSETHVVEQTYHINLVYPHTLHLPAWNPTTHPLGSQLTSVSVRMRLDNVVDFWAENIHLTTCNLTWNAFHEMQFEIDPAYGAIPTWVRALVGDSIVFPFFDGTIDYRGNSGFTWVDHTDGSQTSAVVTTDPALLAAWTSTSDVPITAWGSGIVAAASMCPSMDIGETSLSVLKITVEYEWCEPPVGDNYCFGDGSGAPCPCVNFGGPFSGCANSAGPGASLVGAGSASLFTDDLTMNGFALPPGQPALLFAGLNQPNGGMGAPFGDGLRCAGGDVVRLGIDVADGAGGTTHGPLLLALGGFPAGETRNFQLWYRDPGGPCGSTFNFSNGVSLTVEP